MPKLRKWKPKKDERVFHNGIAVKVIEEPTGNKVKIRNEYGYAETVALSGLRPIED